MQHCVSRSGLVHGQTSFKHVDDGNGRKRVVDSSKLHPRRDDVWYDFERVLLVSYLDYGSFGIWGNLIIWDEILIILEEL